MEKTLLKNWASWAHIAQRETHRYNMQRGDSHIQGRSDSTTTFSWLVGMCRSCLEMVSSSELSGEVLCFMCTYPHGTLLQVVLSISNPSQVIMDLMMGEKVAIMNGSEVNRIVQAMIASLGPLVHGKIFRSSNSCIPASRGSIKDRRMPLQVIIKEREVENLSIGQEFQGSTCIWRVSKIHWWSEESGTWWLGGGPHFIF
jgi:hypothetical protein